MNKPIFCQLAVHRFGRVNTKKIRVLFRAHASHLVFTFKSYWNIWTQCSRGNRPARLKPGRAVLLWTELCCYEINCYELSCAVMNWTVLLWTELCCYELNCYSTVAQLLALLALPPHSKKVMCSIPAWGAVGSGGQSVVCAIKKGLNYIII